MRKVWLIVKVKLVRFLVKFKLIPNVWYSCELELADIKADEMYKHFGWDK